MWKLFWKLDNAHKLIKTKLDRIPGSLLWETFAKVALAWT